MLLRFYFLALAIIMFSPVNERLYGKRVCQEAGFEPNFTFQIKAGMHSGPVSTYIAIAAIMIYCLAFAIRIFERPYFTFNFVDAGVTFYNFEYLTSSLWYTIITMTTVGYGNIYATTPIGRGFAIVAVIVGAFLLSLMVAIITSWFNMDEKRTVAINKMERDRFSA